MLIPYFYRGDGSDGSDVARLPCDPLKEVTDPAGYRADPGLLKAVHVALTLGQPLLITGEPGSGKSLLAHSIARELGLGVGEKRDRALVFETKSTSQGRDLFYHFDTLGFFHSNQIEKGRSPRDFIYFNALGKAILRAHRLPELRAWTVPKGEAVPAQTRSVVLIDELDKAPRDFPNDILNELEQLFFRLPELAAELEGLGPALEQGRIEADKKFAPILILTSNSETELPDAFLRRCVYYDLPFPEGNDLEKILDTRLGQNSRGPLRREALAFFQELRQTSLEKRPALAELLCWLIALQSLPGVSWGQELRAVPEQVGLSLSAVAKTRMDQQLVEKFWQQWRISGKRG